MNGFVLHPEWTKIVRKWMSIPDIMVFYNELERKIIVRRGDKNFFFLIPPLSMHEEKIRRHGYMLRNHFENWTSDFRAKAETNDIKREQEENAEIVKEEFVHDFMKGMDSRKPSCGLERPLYFDVGKK